MARGDRLLTLLLAVLAWAGGLHLREGRRPARAAGNPFQAWFASSGPKVFFAPSLEGCGVAIIQRLWKDSFIWEDSHLQHVVKFPPEWWCGHDWQFREYDEMTSRVAKVKCNDIWALPFQATYPSCGVRDQDHDNRVKNFHPDLMWIHGAVKAAKANLHFFFVHRPLVDALKLTCMTRHYERSCQLQAEALVLNADILISQLAEVIATDHTKISCFNYSSDEYVRGRVRFYFGTPAGVTDPAVNVQMPPSLAYEFEERNISGYATPDTNLTAALEEKSSQLGDKCGQMQEFTLSDLKEMILYAHGDLAHLHTVPPQIILAEEKAGNETANRGNTTRPGAAP